MTEPIALNAAGKEVQEIRFLRGNPFYSETF